MSDSHGQRIRAARRSAGFTQEQLAEKLGISRASVAILEADRQRVRVHQVHRIAEVCGVDATWLAFGTAPNEGPWLPPLDRADLVRQLRCLEHTAARVREILEELP